MWNDLNMRDRHKFIKLAVTNGVYDLDTIHDLYDRKPNMYATGGEITIQPQIPTEPNRPQIDVQPIIDRIRAERLARYTAPDSALAQIKELTDNIRENEFKREFAEWINPTRNTNDYVDIRKTIPVAEARPTFINTYEKGGSKDPPKYSYQWQDDSQKYVKPSNGTQGTSSEVFSFDNPMDPWNRFNYNQGNYIKSGIVTDAIVLGLMTAPAATSVVKPLTTLISKPITTAVKTLGAVNPFIATDLIPAASFADNSINAALAINGINNAFSNNGLQKTYNHFKNKEYYSGIKSGLGDLLDLSGMIGIAKTLNTANKAIQQTRLGQNVLDNIANKVFYLDEPTKFNNWLRNTEANARQKVSDINKYRREHGLMENYMNDENIFSGIDDNIYVHYPYSIYEYGKIQMPNMLKNKISNIKKAYETANSTQGINSHGHILINPRYMNYKVGKSKQSNYLEGLLGHEIDHSYQPHLNPNPAIPGNTYYISNPESPHYNVWKILDSNQKKYPWGASPNEVLSELTNWKIENNSYLTPFKDINDARNIDLIENTALRFNLSYPQSRDLLKGLSELGYF